MQTYIRIYMHKYTQENMQKEGGDTFRKGDWTSTQNTLEYFSY